MGWTEERVDVLRKLWLDGLSASQIAKQLGGGLTRNAVIGKVHRLGLSGRAAPSQPHRPVFKAPRAPRPAAPPAPAPRRTEISVRAEPTPIQMVDEPTSATVLTLGAHMCKWPIGDPATESFGFCGRSCDGDGPYCMQHARVAYQPQQKKASRRTDASELVRSLRRYI